VEQIPHPRTPVGMSPDAVKPAGAALTSTRCARHGEREAAAVCPECGHPLCRECITEHDDKVLCASCLKKTLRPVRRRRLFFEPIGGILSVLGGFLILWVAFYLVGLALASIPSSFHEGVVWERLGGGG
jgi:hypothetical protein